MKASHSCDWKNPTRFIDSIHKSSLVRVPWNRTARGLGRRLIGMLLILHFGLIHLLATILATRSTQCSAHHECTAPRDVSLRVLGQALEFGFSRLRSPDYLSAHGKKPFTSKSTFLWLLILRHCPRSRHLVPRPRWLGLAGRSTS